MTLFLVCASTDAPSPIEGLTFVSVAPDRKFLAPVLQQMNCEAGSVWIASPDDRLESVLASSRDANRDGSGLRDTPLGRVLLAVMGNARSLALFYASFPADLPVASDESGLMTLLEAQLSEPLPQGIELYAVWRSTTAA